tara:strand:- start:1430 stop:2311 length:882 start_codon:yes stop_codon:yes gene_type:complete
MRILILGGSGMLGHTFFKVWKANSEVKVTLRKRLEDYEHNQIFGIGEYFEGIDLRRLDTLRDVIISYKPDCIVNCSGVTKQICNEFNQEDVFTLNALLPHKLAGLCDNFGTRLIQLSTDCIYSGKKGNYNESDISDAEDLYGKSKYQGELNKTNSLTLRKSSIGLELGNKHGLVEWFLNQKGSILGFDKAIYSGFSSIHLAGLIESIIFDSPDLQGIYNIASKPISKYYLLSSLQERIDNFELDIIRDDKIKIDRSLNPSKFLEQTNLKFPSWEKMLDDLGEEINKRKFDAKN